jgi:hypothetical protein
MNEMLDTFLSTNLSRLEDFWRRQEAAPKHSLHYEAFGHPVEFHTNDRRLLEAAEISARRFSRSNPLRADESIRLTVVLDSRLPEATVPQDWPARLRYMGVEDWLAINAEPWVNAYANLTRREGVAFLSGSLARHPHLYSRFICDSFVLNILMRSRLGQLHASCVYLDGKAILFSAPHNSGKSTTAFRMVLAGYQLLSDGMTYARQGKGGIELMGYPAGEIKLRMDMAAEFPQFRGNGRPVVVREDTKLVYNLREIMPDRVLNESVRPEEIVIVLVEKTGQRESHAVPVDRQTALEALFPESVHLDALEVISSDLAVLQAILEKSRCYRLYLGADEAGLLEAVRSL